MTRMCIVLSLVLTVVGAAYAADGVAADRNIDEATARGLATAQYNKLFLDKYYFNSADGANGKFHKYPKLKTDFFDDVKIKDGSWHLVGSPPVGVFVVAKVDVQGEWVQLEMVGFAEE